MQEERLTITANFKNQTTTPYTYLKRNVFSITPRSKIKEVTAQWKCSCVHVRNETKIIKYVSNIELPLELKALTIAAEDINKIMYCRLNGDRVKLNKTISDVGIAIAIYKEYYTSLMIFQVSQKMRMSFERRGKPYTGLEHRGKAIQLLPISDL